jgi:hypothetical protein
LADDIESAGLTWRDYGEGMGTPCNLTDNSGTSYAARHIPFLYYDDIQQSSRCASNVVDYSNFATDLASGLPTYSIIAPNLVHDMHDPFPAQAQNYANGDQWLSSQIPTILGARPWQAGGAGLLIVVWDEDDLSGGITQSTDDPIPMFLISPLAKKGGYSSATQYDHYSLLATIEDSLGLPRLLNASTAQPMADFFVNDSPATASDTADASARTASIPCAMASDCPDDQACDLSSQVCSAQCTSGNCACATDQQCNQATVVCTGGQCVAGCHVAGDCPSTQACQTNTDPGTCASPCSASSCACNADSQCSGIDDDGGTSDGGVGLICSEAGTCISGCNVASDCPSGMTCDTSTSPGTCQSAAADGG